MVLSVYTFCNALACEIVCIPISVLGKINPRLQTMI